MRAVITWGALCAAQPADEVIVAIAPWLSAAYNDPHNAPMMGHTSRIEVDDVIRSYREMIARGDALFVFEHDGALLGDGDLRDVTDGRAELAIMLAQRHDQGRGLGTRCALMLHAYGFTRLGLDRIYVGIVPANTASVRMFTKLGHAVDASPIARAYAESDDEITMSIGRAEFEARHADALAELRYTEVP